MKVKKGKFVKKGKSQSCFKKSCSQNINGYCSLDNPQDDITGKCDRRNW